MEKSSYLPGTFCNHQRKMRSISVVFGVFILLVYSQFNPVQNSCKHMMYLGRSHAAAPGTDFHIIHNYVTNYYITLRIVTTVFQETVRLLLVSEYTGDKLYSLKGSYKTLQ